MKEYDIRPANLYHRYLELLEADAVVYFSAADRTDVPRPACDSPGLEPAFEKSRFTMAVCRNCGTLFQSPRPAREDFARFYQESPSAHYWAETFFPAVAEVRRRNLFRPKVERIAQLCQEEGFFHKCLPTLGPAKVFFWKNGAINFPKPNWWPSNPIRNWLPGVKRKIFTLWGVLRKRPRRFMATWIW